MPGSLLPQPKQSFQDAAGAPLVGGQIATYAAGTLTPKTTYQDLALTIQNENPTPINARGEVVMYGTGMYRAILTAADGTVIYDRDNIEAPVGGNDLLSYVQLSVLAASGGSALIGHAPANTGATLRTVRDKLNEYVSIPDFWRIGDGTDYSSALQRAMDSGEPVITGLGRTYTVAGDINARSNLALSDAVFDAPGLSSNKSVFNFTGTASAAVALTADSGFFSVTVSSAAGIAIDDWVFIKSNAYWSPASRDDVKMGEQVRVAGVSGNIVSFYTGLACTYKISDGATLTKLNHVSNVTLSNLRLLGPVSTGNQGGLDFNLCSDVLVSNVRSSNFDYAHVNFTRCANTRVTQCIWHGTNIQEGLDYGVVVERGCYNTLIDHCIGSAMRHVITIGGSEGVSRHTTGENCRGYGLTDAALDSHSAAIEVGYFYNYMSHSDSVDSEMDGISAQCAQLTVIGSNLNNFRRHGIDWSPEFNQSAFQGLVALKSAANNFTAVQPKVGTGTAAGISASTPNAVDQVYIDSIESTGDRTTGCDLHTFVQAIGAKIRKVSIDAPMSAGAMKIRGIQIYALGAYDIEQVVISAPNLEVSSANEIIFLQGNAAGKVRNWSITGGSLMGIGSNIGVRLSYTENGKANVGAFVGCATPYTADASSTNYQLGCAAPVSAAWAGATIAAGAIAEIVVAVPGADAYTQATVSMDVPLQGCTISVAYTGTGSVKVVIFNSAGVSRTFAACNFTVVAIKAKA